MSSNPLFGRHFAPPRSSSLFSPPHSPSPAGTYNFLDGGVYVGEWRENMRHGQGEYRFPSGAVYIGDWKEDKFWGKGKFWWAVIKEEENDSSYGDWQNNVRHGKGYLALSNGFEYQGQWSHDMIEGKVSASDGGGYVM